METENIRFIPESNRKYDFRKSSQHNKTLVLKTLFLMKRNKKENE